MKIYVSDSDLRKALEDDDQARRLLGAPMGKKLVLRVAAIRAATSLADFWPPKSGPERCHELEGNRAGVFSMDVKQPYRLLFEAHELTATDDTNNEFARWKS